MSKSNATEQDLLKKVFQSVALPFDAIGNLYIALHTADPGEAGTAATNEATYGAYARKAVVRDNTGWNVVAGVASNAAVIAFDECTSGSNTITHFSITTAASGGSQILYSGALTAAVVISAQITPSFPVGAMTISED